MRDSNPRPTACKADVLATAPIAVCVGQTLPKARGSGRLVDGLNMRALADILCPMSFREIKESIAGLTMEERLELAALIAHLNRVEDPAWQNELDRRLDAMTAGRKSTHRDLQDRHTQLSSQGR